MRPTIVYIDQDPQTLGEDATQADLDRYCSNLEAHLAERFNRPIEIIQILGGHLCGRKCPESDEIGRHVRELEAGDGWLELL